ncbi:hypothetical protein NEMBOFW57_010924 [Staphylotrichum longicolle]|uniref:Xylanolytic transcriptional activator regulatory domain-containing protein n=1 Tax=Staphylotrichum longicolle TaxID=669026 RepID=A0AAD4ENM1_9PEZI|nr:hypothetical protein NEMBOFW57_010924 [Staphylotrichum longicolle]
MPESPMGSQASHLLLSIELDDLDLRFLDSYNITIPFELGGPPQPEPSQAVPPMGVSGTSHAATSASEAFQNHHWRFRPNPKDHGAAEEHNLSLPSDARDNPSPESHISFPRRVTAARLSTAARDNILTIVIKSCRPENLPKAVASFPSVELLDTLIQFYLTSSHARADSFIHAATFDPNEKKPELLLAMAAAGAVLTSDPTLTKLGYAMQESLRTAIPKVWESDNTQVRNIELTQAFLINLETGLWSGLSRKVEITESFLQSPTTMFRRGGRFRKSNYPTIIPQTSDQNTPDESAWRSWIQQESFKRTAFRLVQHDLNSSMYLMVNPIISYAEVSLPLPCCPSLWSAPTAQQWHALLTHYPSLSHQPPSVADYLDDPGAFKAPPSSAHPPNLDVTIANEAFLACAWSLAWECIQLTTLQRPATKPAPPRRWNTFLLTSRREELLKLLEHFRLSLAVDDTGGSSSSNNNNNNNNPHAREVRMRLELILLHLHAPFEEVQIFAGIEGPEQARSAYASVLDWAGTEAARKAICHAGQVLRFARGVGRGALQGNGAVVLYQASLVLWVYALISASGHGPVGNANGKGKGGGEVGGPDAVWLDGEDDLAAQRFMHFGVGMPCLRGMESGTGEGGRGDVSVGDPEGVLGATIAILRDNFEGMPKPHLVERLLQLMEALQRSSAGMMEFHGQLGRH